MASSPSLLQDHFASRFEKLDDWEQPMLLASLQRIAAMMDAGELDTAPLLSSGWVRGTPEAVEGVVEPAGDSRSPGDRQNRESERALDPC